MEWPVGIKTASFRGHLWTDWWWRTLLASRSSACDMPPVAVCSCPWGTGCLWGPRRMSELSLTFCNHRDSSLHTAERWSNVLRCTVPRRPCQLTKYAVEGPHDDVVLLGDGGDKHTRWIWDIYHLNRKSTNLQYWPTTLSINQYLTSWWKKYSWRGTLF